MIKDLVGKDYYNYVALMGRSSAQRCHGGDRASCSVEEMGKKETLVAMVSAQMPVMSGRPAIQRLQTHESTRFGQQSLHRVQKGSYSPEMMEEDKMSPGYRGKTEREVRAWPELDPRLVPNAQDWGCPWCPPAALLLAAVVGQALVGRPWWTPWATSIP